MKIFSLFVFMSVIMCAGIASAAGGGSGGVLPPPPGIAHAPSQCPDILLGGGPEVLPPVGRDDPGYHGGTDTLPPVAKK